MRHSHTPNNIAAPAVINFNPMNIPELSRPGTKNGVLTNALNKSNNGTANVVSDGFMRNSMPAPFVSPGPFKGTTPNQTPALFDGKSDLLGKLDIESVDSDEDYMPSQHINDVALSGNSANNEDEEETALNQKENTCADNEIEEKEEERNCEEIIAKGIRLSLTTVGGVPGGVQIYDYDKRG